MSDVRTVSRVLPVVGAFVAGLVLVLGAIIYFAGHAPSPIGPAAAAVGGPFQLEDQAGKPVSDQDMKGRPFLVFFGYTHCPDICPTSLFEISEILKALGKDADRTGALFRTVAPERDTPISFASSAIVQGCSGLRCRSARLLPTTGSRAPASHPNSCSGSPAM